MEFLVKNFVWVALIVASGAMLLWPMLRRSAAGIAELGPNEAVMLINREHALVVDVREEQEFAAGHIPEARNLPLSRLDECMKELHKHKQKPLLITCLSGMRSDKACAQLKQAGFSNMYMLKGGFNAWNQAKLPVAKD